MLDRHPTDLEGPASSVLVVVADPLQLAAARKLPDDKLQAPPETFTVEEGEELGQPPEDQTEPARRQTLRSSTTPGLFLLVTTGS